MKRYVIAIGSVIAGAMIAGCSHYTFGKKVTQESINDPYTLYNGIKTPYSAEKAYNLAKKQCEKNDLEACFLYGYLLTKGEGVKKNEEEAYKVFEKSCNGYEKTINVTENGTLTSKKVLFQDKNSCYFVAQKLFDEKKFIEAYQKYEIYLKGGGKSRIIADDNTSEKSWKYKRMLFDKIPFDSIMSFKNPTNQIDESKAIIYEEQKDNVILFENIAKIKGYAPKVLAFYDFMIAKAKEEKSSQKLFFYNKNKASLLEALGKIKEAESIYKENCELNDRFSCIYYKNIKVRGGNLK